MNHCLDSMECVYGSGNNFEGLVIYICDLDSVVSCFISVIGFLKTKRKKLEAFPSFFFKLSLYPFPFLEPVLHPVIFFS